jgi:hypothetical protein
MKRSAVRSGLLWAAAWLAASSGWAFDFQGPKNLIAVTRDGGQTRIGAVHFTPQTGGAPARFEVRIDPKVMQDHFLSMREFKCLPAAQEISCFVPYPHPHPGTVGPGQLAWLEHHLLFFFKQPADFGAKLWNGVIFKFSLTPTSLIGTPQAVDLNRIAAPPDNASEPPFGGMDRDDFAPGSRWVQELRIE